MNRLALRAAAVGAAAAMGAGFAAGPAHAQSAERLTSQLRADPYKLLDPFWFFRAATQRLQIPATIRLAPANRTAAGAAPSQSRVAFDIGETLDLGVKTTTVFGTQRVTLGIGRRFGDVTLTIPTQPGGNGTALGAGLNAAPVSLFTDPELTATGYTDGGCANFPSGAPGFTLPSPDDITKAPFGLDPGIAAGATAPAATTAWFADKLQNTTNRTNPLSLAISQPVNGSSNLITGKIAPFQLSTSFAIANITRSPSGANRCRQVWSGATQAQVTLNLAGSLSLAPGITADRKIKIADIRLATPAGQESAVTLPACLSPYKFFTTPPTAPGGPKVTSQPTAACGADGSAVPVEEGGSPSFKGGGLGRVDVPAKASVTQLVAELVL